MKCLVVKVLRLVFGLFYSKKYLRWYFFETKKMGWYWCLMGLPSRLWGANRRIPWPVNPNTLVSDPNVVFDIDNINIFQTPGCYWQCKKAAIKIGKGSWVAPNVGIITTNHDIYDVGKHVNGRDVVIGEYSWVGMNSMILPGVVLGPHTVVGAGSVVTKSFPNGYCVIAGVPAKLVKTIDCDVKK